MGWKGCKTLAAVEAGDNISPCQRLDKEQPVVCVILYFCHTLTTIPLPLIHSPVCLTLLLSFRALENRDLTVRTQRLEYRVWAGFDAVMTLFFTSTHWPRSLESLGSFHLVWLYLVLWVYFSTFYLPFDEKTRAGTERHGVFHVATPSVLRHRCCKISDHERNLVTIAAYFSSSESWSF